MVYWARKVRKEAKSVSLTKQRMRFLGETNAFLLDLKDFSRKQNDFHLTVEISKGRF